MAATVSYTHLKDIGLYAASQAIRQHRKNGILRAGDSHVIAAQLLTVLEPVSYTHLLVVRI